MQRTILKLEQELEAISMARMILSYGFAIDPVTYAVLTAANKEDG